jgi:4-amino-4-deoxy-L-arabinose transferase-like glycosyltransferase
VSAPRPFSVALPLALHVALFVGLFQVGYDRDQWSEVKRQARVIMRAAGKRAPEAVDEGILVVLERRGGPLPYLRAFYRMNSDEGLYRQYARLVLGGELDLDYILDKKHMHSDGTPLPARPLPYRDVQVEYPPLALLFMAPPGLLGQSYRGYALWLGVWLCGIHLLNLWLALGLVRGAGGRAASLRRLAWWSLGFCLLIGTLVVTRIDSVVTLWILLALHALLRGLGLQGPRGRWWALACGGLLGLGVMTKLVPGLVLPLAMLVYLRMRRGREGRVLAGAAALGCAGVVLALNGAALAAFGGGYLASYRYHMQRPVQIETLYGGVMFVLHFFGLPLEVRDSYGSTNLVHPGRRLITLLSPALLLGLLLVVLGRLWRVTGQPAAWRQREGVLALLGTVALLMAFMLSSKVLSPQYLIWIALPLLTVVATQPRSRLLGALFLLTALLSQLIFPVFWGALEHMHPALIALLNLRNVLLVVILALVLRALGRDAGQRPVAA